MPRSTLPLSLAILLSASMAGCIAPPAPPPRDVPRPRISPLPPREPPSAVLPAGADWRDWPVTPGVWRYERDTRGSRALFGSPRADAALVLRCDLAARRIYLSRAGILATVVTIRTSSMVRSVAMRSTGGTPAYIAADVAVADPLLDAIAFSRGRFAIEQSGAVALVAPAWAEIGRVVEDCRG